MKEKFLLLIGVVLFTAFSYAQEQPNSKLCDVYTTQHLANLKNNNPDAITYFNFYVNNSFEIVEAPDKPINKVELKRIDFNTKAILSDEIIENDLMDFNPLLYNCVTSDSRTYYSIGNTGKLLVMYSTEEIQVKFKQLKK